MENFLGFLLGAGAAGAPASGDATSITPTLITFGLIAVVFYFFLIRPQSQRQKKTKQMLEQLKRGDRVVTIGGIRGAIHSMKDELVVIKVDSDTTIEFTRNAIASVVNSEGQIAESPKGDKGSVTKSKESTKSPDKKK